jgi:hypothetical protein
MEWRIFCCQLSQPVADSCLLGSPLEWCDWDPLPKTVAACRINIVCCKMRAAGSTTAMNAILPQPSPLSLLLCLQGPPAWWSRSCAGRWPTGGVVPVRRCAGAQLCQRVWRRPGILCVCSRHSVPTLPPAKQHGRLAGWRLVLTGKGAVCGEQGSPGEDASRLLNT